MFYSNLEILIQFIILDLDYRVRMGPFSGPGEVSTGFPESGPVCTNHRPGPTGEGLGVEIHEEWEGGGRPVGPF